MAERKEEAFRGDLMKERVTSEEEWLSGIEVIQDET